MNRKKRRTNYNRYQSKCLSELSPLALILADATMGLQPIETLGVLGNILPEPID